MVYTISMDWSRVRSAGTDFTVQDSFVHLLSQLAGATGLWLAGSFGYQVVVAAGIVLAALGTFAAVRLFRERPPDR